MLLLKGIHWPIVSSIFLFQARTSLFLFFFYIDVKRVAKAEKTKTNASHHVVVRMVEFAMRKRSNVTVHQDGSVKYAPTGASQDVTD